MNIFFLEKSHPVTSWACPKKKSLMLSYENTLPNISFFLNGKVRCWSVNVFFRKIVGSKIRILFFLLIMIDWDPVKLSGKTAMISTKPRPPQSCYLFWIDHLIGKSSFKRGTEVFSFYIIGEMFRKNELFVDFVAASCVLIFITWYVTTCQDTKDNAGLCVPVSKPITTRRCGSLYLGVVVLSVCEVCYVYEGYVGSAVVLYIWEVSWDVWSKSEVVGLEFYWKLIAKMMGLVCEVVAGFLHGVVFIGCW